MTLYIGIDFHPHSQTIAWRDENTEKALTIRIDHDPKKMKEFLEALPEGAIIGIEATSRAVWFEKLVSETGHILLVGNSVLIKKRATSRHHSDARDAVLILELLERDEFPVIWRRPDESNCVLDIIGLRHCLVKQRTQSYNRLQSMAHSIGMRKGRVRTATFQALLKAAEVNETDGMRRDQLFLAVEQLNRQIGELSDWLKKKAKESPAAQLLETQKGVGYLTALVTAHTLGDVKRFKRVGKEVASYAGLDPCERSSGARVRFGSITKAGSSLLRYHLGQAVSTAARYDPKLKTFYGRLCKKKRKSVAKTAASRKLLIKLAIMSRDNITAHEFDRRGSTVGNARDGKSLK
mgnify:CR=1 FL=1|jgi:transposase